MTNPSKRRALRHLDLRLILKERIPETTTDYFNSVADELPKSAITLLTKKLLERGFQLHCKFCSFTSWYPVQNVGQTFECTRCNQVQIYDSNPLWLYKLPEVIFQGFEDHMEVPLLALAYLQSRCSRLFEWEPDSNLYWVENEKEKHQNLDILCLIDGKIYLGEAKSNDEIAAKQFSFYERVCLQTPIGGIVFATSRPQWNKATSERIIGLKNKFKGR